MSPWMLRACAFAIVFTLPQAVQEGSQRGKVAFITFLSSDPEPGQLGKVDGAGVLAESIRSHMGHLNYDMLAVVTPEVQASRPILKRYGYKIREYETPDLSLVRNPYLRSALPTDGCCGAAEMLKLTAYTMTEYIRTFVMDTDTLVHGSFEELLYRKETTLYTAPWGAEGELLQAGFLVIMPNPKMFEDIMNTWYAGQFDTDGWNHSGIGYMSGPGLTNGGRTVQGILPYFAKKVYPEHFAKLDFCVYNNPGDTSNHYCAGRDPKTAKLNHFVDCPKPWYCKFPEYPNDCRYFTYAWWDVRNKLAIKMGRSNSKQTPCDGRHDISLAYPPLFAETGPAKNQK